MYILGIPVKISSQKSVYFPVNYLHFYGFDRYYDYLIREQLERGFLFLPYCKRILLQNEAIVTLRASNTYLPEQWINDNHLIAGQDSLYLVGIDNGLLISTTQKIEISVKPVSPVFSEKDNKYITHQKV